MIEWLRMGGHDFYIWWSYGALALPVVAPGGERAADAERRHGLQVVHLVVQERDFLEREPEALGEALEVGALRDARLLVEDPAGVEEVGEAVGPEELRHRTPVLGGRDGGDLAAAVLERSESLQRWKEIYWNDFIPLAHGVRQLGRYYTDAVRPDDPYEFVGLLKSADMLASRRNQVMADLAALSAGGVAVPIYTSLLPDQVRYIVDHAGAKIAVCSDRDLLRKIEAVRGELPGLEHIVLVEGEAPSGTLALSAVLDMGAGLERGSPGLFERTAGSVRPGDLASIIYTSGTTSPGNTPTVSVARL